MRFSWLKLKQWGALSLPLLTGCGLGASDWPQWRGLNRDGHAPITHALPDKLTADLQPLWKIATGPGFSSPIVADGKLIFLDEREGKETVNVVNAATGQKVWSVSFAEAKGDEWGTGPRSTPIADGDRLYVQSMAGEFRCVALADGKILWQVSYAKDYGMPFLGSKAGEGTATRRGNAGSGVIDGDRIFLPVGSTKGATIVCFNKETGKEIWRCLDEEAAYSSFVMAKLAGAKQVVALTADALVGVSPADGRVLWRVPVKTNAKRHAASPVIIGGDQVVVNSHTIGMVCFKITKENDTFKATEAWANKSLKINIATPVLVEEHLYSQGANKDYVCVEAASGKLKWSQPGFGRGTKDYSSTIAVGRKLLVLTEDGQLVLMEANPTKYTELGRQQICGNTWCHPAYAAGKLYVKDSRELACFDLAANR